MHIDDTYAQKMILERVLNKFYFEPICNSLHNIGTFDFRYRG